MSNSAGNAIRQCTTASRCTVTIVRCGNPFLITEFLALFSTFPTFSTFSIHPLVPKVHLRQMFISAGGIYKSYMVKE